MKRFLLLGSYVLLTSACTDAGAQAGEDSTTSSSSVSTEGAGVGDGESAEDADAESEEGSTTTGSSDFVVEEGHWHWSGDDMVMENECGALGELFAQRHSDKLWRIDASSPGNFAVTDWWSDEVQCAIDQVEGEERFECGTTAPTAILNPTADPGLGVGTFVASESITGTFTGTGEGTSSSSTQLDCEGDGCTAFAADNGITFPCTVTLERAGWRGETPGLVDCAELDTVTSQTSGQSDYWYLTLYNATDETLSIVHIDNDGYQVQMGNLLPFRRDSRPTDLYQAWALLDSNGDCRAIVGTTGHGQAYMVGD